jgi:hypothetical protein
MAPPALHSACISYQSWTATSLAAVQISVVPLQNVTKCKTHLWFSLLTVAKLSPEQVSDLSTISEVRVLTTAVWSGRSSKEDENLECYNFKTGGTQSNHSVLKGFTGEI